MTDFSDHSVDIKEMLIEKFPGMPVDTPEHLFDKGFSAFQFTSPLNCQSALRLQRLALYLEYRSLFNEFQLMQCIHDKDVCVIDPLSSDGRRYCMLIPEALEVLGLTQAKVVENTELTTMLGGTDYSIGNQGHIAAKVCTPGQFIHVDNTNIPRASVSGLLLLSETSLSLYANEKATAHLIHTAETHEAFCAVTLSGGPGKLILFDPSRFHFGSGNLEAEHRVHVEFCRNGAKFPSDKVETPQMGFDHLVWAGGETHAERWERGDEFYWTSAPPDKVS